MTAQITTAIFLVDMTAGLMIVKSSHDTVFALNMPARIIKVWIRNTYDTLVAKFPYSITLAHASRSLAVAITIFVSAISATRKRAPRSTSINPDGKKL